MNIEIKKSTKPIEYLEAIDFLEKRLAQIDKRKDGELVWILEHFPIYTAGTNYKENEILDKTIKIVKTNRGGKITYHGPGQKIVYFVLNLNRREKDIRKLIIKIENCIIDILSEYKIKSYTDKKNIGIWVGNKSSSMKIAAIGIRVKKWIAYHGFALNISNDLSKYNGIIPCGIKDKGITSLKKLGIKKYDNIEKIITKSFLNVFH